MDDDRYSAYFVSRRGYKPRPSRRGNRRRSHRAAGLLITALLLLSAAICLLVVFLPRLTSADGVAASPNFGGKTFFFLATAKSDDRDSAELNAVSSAERGGAGYIYNDGSYHVVAALYDRESDAKTLATVNQNSYYFALVLPAVGCGESDKAALDFVVGEFCSALTTAAVELDRGNITEAAAEFAAGVALNKLRSVAVSAENARLSDALTRVADDAFSGDRSVLSGIRYVQIAAVVAVRNAYR